MGSCKRFASLGERAWSAESAGREKQHGMRPAVQGAWGKGGAGSMGKRRTGRAMAYGPGRVRMEHREGFLVEYLVPEAAARGLQGPHKRWAGLRDHRSERSTVGVGPNGGFCEGGVRKHARNTRCAEGSTLGQGRRAGEGGQA